MEHKFAEAMTDMSLHGISFDTRQAKLLKVTLTEKLSEIDSLLSKMVPLAKIKAPPLKSATDKNGNFTHAFHQWVEAGGQYTILSNGGVERWRVAPANLNSPSVLRDYLLQIGWSPSLSPDAWNFQMVKSPSGKLVKVKGPDGKYIRTTPKLPSNDHELVSLKEKSPAFQLIAERLQVSHRLHVIEGYLERSKDNTITMSVNSCGTNTFRVRHSGVANVPRVGSFLGLELRQLFKARPGKVFVGCDASSQEARNLAHYLDSKYFTQFVLEADIHTFFAKILKDFISLDPKIARTQAKSIEYAYLYGAGDEKLGSLATRSIYKDVRIRGEKIRKLLLSEIPNLEKFLDEMGKIVAEHQVVPIPGGGFAHIRYKHAILNTLNQALGAHQMKVATGMMYKRLKDIPEARIVIFYHDEVQVECRPEDAEKVGKMLVECIIESGRRLELKVPMDGEYKIGANWAETH